MLLKARFVVIPVLACFIIAFSCKSRATGVASFVKLAEVELGKNFSSQFNAEKSYVLCKQSRTNDHVNSSFKYCVIDVRSNQIAHKGSYQSGSVKWIDSDNIQVTTTEKFSLEPIEKTIRINKPQQ